MGFCFGSITSSHPHLHRLLRLGGPPPARHRRVDLPHGSHAHGAHRGGGPGNGTRHLGADGIVWNKHLTEKKLKIWKSCWNKNGTWHHIKFNFFFLVGLVVVWLSRPSAPRLVCLGKYHFGPRRLIAGGHEPHGACAWGHPQRDRASTTQGTSRQRPSFSRGGSLWKVGTCWIYFSCKLKHVGNPMKPSPICLLHNQVDKKPLCPTCFVPCWDLWLFGPKDCWPE